MATLYHIYRVAHIYVRFPLNGIVIKTLTKTTNKTYLLLLAAVTADGTVFYAIVLLPT